MNIDVPSTCSEVSCKRSAPADSSCYENALRNSPHSSFGKRHCSLLRPSKRQISRFRSMPYVPPAAPLVGIEPNPGPNRVGATQKIRGNGNPKSKRTTNRAPRLRGRGDYSLGGIGRSIGSSLGGSLGNLAGTAIGSIFGMGDYTVRSNSLMASDKGPPTFVANNDGSVTLSHREYLGDVTSSTAFSLSGYAINPGITATFPWLSQIAQNFEQYEFLGLIFSFKSTSAVAVSSTNTALGTVIMATEYNAYAPNFATKQVMEAYEFCTSSSPANSFIHPIECAPGQTSIPIKYIRNTNIATTDSNVLNTQNGIQDKRFYDMGNFQIATVGMQAASNIGELWVSYHVRLLKPRLPTSAGNGTTSFHWSPGTGTQASPFSPVKSPSYDTNEGSVSLYSDNTLLINKIGVVMISLYATDSGLATTWLVNVVGANLTPKLILNGDSDPSNSGVNATNTSAIINVFYTVTAATGGAANRISFVGPGGLTNTNVDLFVHFLPSDVI